MSCCPDRREMESGGLNWWNQVAISWGSEMCVENGERGENQRKFVILKSPPLLLVRGYVVRQRLFGDKC